jgi:hypothetical protein
MSSSYTNSFEKENVTNSFQYAIMISIDVQVKKKH